MDEINEQTENMKQIQEALATPIGAGTDFDEVLPLEMMTICLVYFFHFRVKIKCLCHCRMNWKPSLKN